MEIKYIAQLISAVVGKNIENPFWEVNFWGIVGTITGIGGLCVSWLNWMYSKPKIDIVKLELYIPRTKDYLEKTKDQYENFYIEYNLRIRLRNKKGGSGSIEKPNLILRFPKGKRVFMFLKYTQINIGPTTSHREWSQDSKGLLSSSELIRDGEAWNIGGGEIIDDELEYHLKPPEEFYEVIQNIKNVEYFIEYSDNFGKPFRKKIASIIEML